jgi:hypothetical protein
MRADANAAMNIPVKREAERHYEFRAPSFALMVSGTVPGSERSYDYCAKVGVTERASATLRAAPCTFCSYGAKAPLVATAQPLLARRNRLPSNLASTG